MTFEDNEMDINQEVNFDDFEDSAETPSVDESNNYDNMSDLDGLDLGYAGNTERTRKITMWAMIGTGAAIVTAFCLIGGLWATQKSNEEAIKSWVSDYIQTNAADAGISEDQMDDIAERVTPLFFDQFGDAVDLSSLPPEQIEKLVEQIKVPLKDYIAEDATNLLSEDMVKQYIDKEYGDVAEMNSRLKEIEATQSTMNNTVTNLKETAAKGAKGDKGEKGDTGAQGPAGQNGQQGSQGSQGARGNDGSNGKDGKDGKQGEKGEDGKSSHIDASAKVDGKQTLTINNTGEATKTVDIVDGKNGKATYILYAKNAEGEDIQPQIDSTHNYMGTITVDAAEAGDITAAIAKVNATNGAGHGVTWTEIQVGRATYSAGSNGSESIIRFDNDFYKQQ